MHRRPTASTTATSRPKWTAARLQKWLATHYAGESVVVLANREPFQHDWTPDGAIAVRRSSGGLVTALEPVIQASSGTWVALGSGTADRSVVDGRDGVDVPPANPAYRLRRVWLEPEEERRYYYGFANSGLWPLCHRTHVRPAFQAEDFKAYHSVNARFARAVSEETESERALVLVQDYHFALAPGMIRERLPLSTIVAFWHIPWPEPRTFAECPWGRHLLQGLLGSTIVGFQTPQDCRNFIDCVAATLDAHIDHRRDVIVHDDRTTTVRPYPVSVEWPSRWADRTPPADVCRQAIRDELHLPADIYLGVGVDRMDYTKGIHEKFLAVERLLERHPVFHGQFAFVQIAEPSRSRLPAYQEARSRIAATAERINRRFGTDRYRPVVLLETHHDQSHVYRFLRAADVCYVGSLHDGMNLVAKEFVAARDDGQGVLILSELAGAARELTAALMVNPYCVDSSAQTLRRALTMPAGEQASRMRTMRSLVARANAFRWAGRMLADATRLRLHTDVAAADSSLACPPAAIHA